jgi:hypothetical protein
MLTGTVQCRSDYIQIARGTAVHAGLALLRQAKLRAVVDAGRNIDFQFALPPQIAFALALLAGTANDLPSSAALRAASAHRQERLLVNHFAAAAAGGARRQSVFRFRAFTMAAPAFFKTRHLNIGAEAAHGIFESDFEVVTQILSTLRAIAALARSAAEHIGEAENIAQDVAKIGEPRAVESAARRRGNTLVPEAIISRALLRITQHAIRFGGFLEPFLRAVIAGIAIRMVLQSELPVRRFERLIVASALDTEHLVVIALGQAHFDAGSTATFTIAGRSKRPLKLYPR